MDQAQTPQTAASGTPQAGSGPSHLLVRRPGPAPHPWDLWYWYGERLAFLPGFLLPPIFAFLPALAMIAAAPGLDVVVKTASLIATGLVALDVAILLGLGIFHFQWWVVVALMLWLELWLLLWLLKNLEFLRQWRRFDRFIARREKKALEVYQRRGFIRRFHFWGVVMFTFLPLNSGVFMGVFIGKITGMPTRTLLAAVYLGLVLWIAFVTWVVQLSIDFLLPLVGVGTKGG